MCWQAKTMMDVIYLDNNATTKPAPEVVAEMLPYWTEFYGNPSSVHRFGQHARKAIDDARGRMARLTSSFFRRTTLPRPRRSC